MSGELGLLVCPRGAAASQLSRVAMEAAKGGKAKAKPKAKPGPPPVREDREDTPKEGQPIRLKKGEESVEMQLSRVAKTLKFLKTLKGKFVPYGPKPWHEPRFVKVCIQARLDVKQGANTKIVNQVTEEVRRISGRHPRIIKARHNVAKFSQRVGDTVGVGVTLYGQKMRDFLTRLNTIILPRVRDFEGLYANSFDNFGNFWFSLPSQEPFKELDDLVDSRELVHGFDIGILNNCFTQPDGLKLMQQFGFPIGDPRKRRPVRLSLRGRKAGKAKKKTSKR